MGKEDALDEKALEDVAGGDIDIPGLGDLGVLRCTGCGEEWTLYALPRAIYCKKCGKQMIWHRTETTG